jgi:uncharacterized membrane protein (UPF0127 family)
MTRSRVIYNKKIFIAVASMIIMSFSFWGCQQDYEQKSIKINNQKIIVDIADTEQKRKLGLGNRESLCNDCGMFFVFDDIKPRTFWMKNMNFDIDIIWIRGNVVVEISENISHKMQEKEIYSKESVNGVLELPAGSAQKFGISIGNSIHY